MSLFAPTGSRAAIGTAAGSRRPLPVPPRPYPPVEAATGGPRQSLASGTPWRAVLLAGGLLAAGFALARPLLRRRSEHPEAAAAGRSLKLAGAGVLAGSVLVDSSISHYRGSFHRRLMYVPPPTAALTMMAAAAGALRPGLAPGAMRLVFGTAAAAGVVGAGFHVYNVGKRPGGFSWNNLFYGAPLGAPGALFLAGAIGLSAEGAAPFGFLARRPRWQALVCAAGLLGTVAEVAVLHYRGAFHNRYMFVPLVVPSMAAAAVLALAIDPHPARLAAGAALLAATGLTGGLGVAFHSYGVHRNMGGWGNAGQNVLNGPPLGAPPGFTAIACYGLGALQQFREAENGPRLQGPLSPI